MYSDGLDSNAQAYSVFKLLIAALVAVAILLVLMPIIASVMGLIKTDPGKAITDKINNLLDRPGQLDHTGDVTFTPDLMLSGSAITHKLQIARDQLCFSTGEFESNEDSGFSVSQSESSSDKSEERLSYRGNTDQQVDLAVMCHFAKSELFSALEGAPGLEDVDLDESDCVCPERGDCCIVIVQRT